MTNTGRSILLGEVPHPWEYDKYTYRQIAKLSRSPNTIYLDLNYKFRAVAVPQNAKPDQSSLRLDVPLSPYPRGSEDFFHSAASLEDVREIQFCSAADRITGVLLRYGDGSSAILGSVQLNKLGTSQQITNALWILIERNDLKFPRVVRILVEEPSRDAEQYFQVYLYGSLEWWFSWRQCQLYYEGNSTIPTRL